MKCRGFRHLAQWRGACHRVCSCNLQFPSSRIFIVGVNFDSHLVTGILMPSFGTVWIYSKVRLDSEA